MCDWKKSFYYIWRFVGICCPTLKVTSTGPAKDEQNLSMGNYEYHKLGENGKEIFKYGGARYIFVSRGWWTVRSITLNIFLCIIWFLLLINCSQKILNYIQNFLRLEVIILQLEWNYNILVVRRLVHQVVAVNGNTLKIMHG